MPHPDLIMYQRAPRSTVVQQIELEQHQAGVIAALKASGDDDIAARLQRCQTSRMTRRPSGWPLRCDSPGCWQCRRATVRRFWRGACIWLGSNDSSLAYFPSIRDPFEGTRHLRRSLRDLRDRRARHDDLWSAVAWAGLIDGDRALVLVQHAGLTRDEIWTALEARWRSATLHDVDAFEPTSALTVDHAAEIARRRRSIEPIRVVVPRQREPPWDDDEIGAATQPMPMCW